MGDPNTGAIYRGALRKEGDVPLNEQQAEWLKSIPVQDRMLKLQDMARKLQSAESGGDSPSNLIEDSGVVREMPRYKCHKEVWALKIKGISDPNGATDGSRVLAFDDEGYAPFCVTGDFMLRHRPEVGGYYVRYKDGYESYSPAQAFEEGYARI